MNLTNHDHYMYFDHIEDHQYELLNHVLIRT